MTRRGDFKPFTQWLSNWDQNAREVLTTLQQLTVQWTRICDDQLALHCRPLWIRNYQLSIEADSALWANRIHHSRAMLLTRLHTLGFADIRGVEAKVRPATLTRQPVSSKESVSTEVIQDMRTLAASIQDPTLRNALLRLALTVEHK
ncbi:MAG TPA: DUF721 domain-containing protein [Gammaproteobacteria bacterium]|nr:DUF721 domain-containing protein [Gammaproteobacteria bacterium]